MLLLVVYQKEHPTPFLHAKISLFSYANVFLFRAGRRGGMIEGGGGTAPKTWDGICVRL